MKKFLHFVAAATALLFVSCKFDDSDIWMKINNLEQRILVLEELCKQMNTNISSLQVIVEALQNNDYITSITPITKDGDIVGYTINFTESDPITIYHGKDGKDGKDGSVPQIGVLQDTDGVYYWTIDGKWLLDEYNNKIRALGSTPRLKIDNDYWYVSYDYGETWVQLSKATGDDGDSLFQSVTYDEEYVYITLVDGTTITFKKYKEDEIDDICLLMEDLSFMKYCYENFDANGDGMVSPIEAASVYTIDIRGLDVYSLAGIEYFTRLENIHAAGCKNIRSVTIPESVTSIGEKAFYDCTSLTSVTMSNSVTSIGNSAFFGCTSLTDVTIPGSVISIGKSAFSYCESLINLTISEGVVNIEDQAFCECISLSSVTIPNSVTSIGRSVFKNCTGELVVNCNISDVSSSNFSIFSDAKFVKIITGEGVTSIGNYAFYNCSSLTSITLSNSITSIGNYAFQNCTGELIVNCNIMDAPDYSYGVFYGSQFTKVTIGDGVTLIGNYAFYNCSSLTSITIPNSVTSIGNSTFYNCHSLANVKMGSAVSSIGNSAFFNCFSLSSVTIPSNITSIGNSAFKNCSSLVSVVIPNRMTSINDDTFHSCTGLTDVTIGNGVTSIGNSAFYSCSSLCRVTIPDSVVSIGNSAFRYCYSLVEVYCKPINPPLGGNNMFSSNESSRRIYVRKASLNTYKIATYWNNYSSYIVGYNF